jgi:hypothetical protein
MYDNGVIYQGEFEKGFFHGNGVLIYPNGVIYHNLGKIYRHME